MQGLAIVAGIVLAGYGFYTSQAAFIGIGVALIAAVLLLRVLASLLHLVLSAAVIGIVAYLVYRFGQAQGWW